MAGLENNKEVKAGKSKTVSGGASSSSSSSPSPSPSYAVLNRSFTKYSNTKPYLQSTTRFYNSIESMRGKVKKLYNVFESSRTSKTNPNESAALAQKQPSPDGSNQNHKFKAYMSMGPDVRRLSVGFAGCGLKLPGTEDRIVVYLTSLRGIRRTFEDCYAVRIIFRGFRVWVDERDMSMDSAYRRELQSVLGEKNISLPQVFIRGYYVGGCDVIKSLFETGELAKILDGFPRRTGFGCDGCGDVRFIPCGNCSGSRKLFDEDEGTLKRCMICNENGLVRCPNCCP